MDNSRLNFTVKDLLFGIVFIIVLFLFFYNNSIEKSGLTDKSSFVNFFLIPLLIGLVIFYLYKRQQSKTKQHEDLLAAERQKISISQKYLNEVANGNLNVEITEEKIEGNIFHAIDTLRKSLYQAKLDEKNRVLDDEKRNWATEGMAKFGEILRQTNSDFNEYCYAIISNLVKYLDAKQGGIFMLNDDDEEKFLELKACYAYDRKIFVQKQIKLGEGLAGACFLEKQTIYMTNVPNDYVSITSGLGGNNPRSIVIVPLKIDQDVCGVIEMASFNTFEDYQIKFIEKIAESIASSITNVKINFRTAALLEQSQQQAETMKAQEEEMRQNNEELQATQEEIERQNKEMQHYQKIMMEKEEKLKYAAKELEYVEIKLKGNIERLKHEQYN